MRSGTFTVPNSTGALSKITATDPKWIMLVAGYATADGSVADNQVLSVGVGTYRGGSVQQGYVCMGDDDGNTTPANSAGVDSTAILKGFVATGTSAAPTIDYELDLVDFASDGVNLTVTDAPTTNNIVVHYWIGEAADGFDDAWVTKQTMPTASSTWTIDTSDGVPSGIGNPNTVVFLHASRASAGDAAQDGGIHIGVANSSTERISSQYVSEPDGGNQGIGTYQVAKALTVLGTSGDALDGEADLDEANYPTDGIEMDITDQVTRTIHVVQLWLFGSFTSTVGQATTLTSTTTQDLSHDNTPIGAMIWGGSSAASASVQTGGQSESFWVGVTALTNEGGAGVANNNAASSSQAGRFHRTDKALAIYLGTVDTTTAPAVDSLADASANGSNLRLTYTDAAASGTAFCYWIIGAGTTPVTKEVAITYDIINTVTKEVAITYDILNAVTKEVAVDYDILNAITREWSLTYDLINAVSREWAVDYDLGGAITREWAVTYDLLNAVTREWEITYDLFNTVTREWAVNYDILNAVSRQWAIDYDIINGISREWVVAYDIGEVLLTLIPEFICATRPPIKQPEQYSIGRRIR